MPEENRKAIEDRHKWSKPEAEACLEGVKVHDDKSRRKEKEKSKSKKDWLVVFNIYFFDFLLDIYNYC